jgi:hypothetical protein
MTSGRVWPQAQVTMDNVPNVLAGLDLAEQLGHPVRGRELVAPVWEQVPVAELATCT